MHEFVSFNHQISHPQQINLPALSSAALYGKGIFTTVAIYKGQPFLWENHWRRLTENALRLSMDLSDFSEISVKKSLFELISKNIISDARARLTFFDGSSSQIWEVETDVKTALLITTANFRPVAEKLSLIDSPYPVNSRSPLVNIKSCNYLENLYSLREAQKNGFDEAIRVNEKGKIASACLANLFWIKDEKIFTPALETGALEGTTRAFILKNFTVYEVSAQMNEIENAETVFLASAGLGIAEVKNFGRFQYQSNEIFREIKRLFGQFTKLS